MHRSLVLLWVAAGCDYALRIDHVDERLPDAAPMCLEIGHDEDNDGLDDACDPCPFDTNNEGDGDSDGIAAACDPDPTTPNKVLLFDGFGRLNPDLLFAGGILDNDTYRPGLDTTSALLWPGMSDPVWVVAGVDVSGQTSASYREVGFVFDATPGLDAVDGTYCVLGRSGEDYAQVFIRNRPDNDVDVHTQSSTLPLADLRSGIIRGRHLRADRPGTSCTFQNNVGQQTGVSGVRTPAPAQAGVAIFGTQVDATYAFLFVVGPA